MRRSPIASLAAALALLLAPPVAGFAQDEPATMADETIVRLLDRARLEPELVQPGKIRYEAGGIQVYLENTRRDALLQAGFNAGGEGDALRVERWNLANADGSRAYLDKDGDPWIEADIDFEGGLTPTAVRGRILAFNEAAARFRRQVVNGEEEVAAPPPGPDRDVPPGRIAGVLEALGLDYRCGTNAEAPAGGVRRQYNITHDGEEIVLRVDTAGRLLLRDSHAEAMDPVAVNAWNRERRFARVVRDGPRPTLESALVLAPDDLTDAAIRQWIAVFQGSRKTFHKDLVVGGRRGSEPAPTPAPTRTPTAGWTVQQVAGTGFRVAMPGDPEVNREPVDSRDGPIPSILLRVKSGQAMFVAGRQEYARDVANLDDDGFFAQVVEGLAPEGGKITEQRAIEVDGLAARELAIEAPAGDGPARSALARVAREGHVGYFLLAGAPAGQLDRARALAFFASFARVREPDPAPAAAPPAAAAAPGPVPFSSRPAPPELYDLSRAERDIPDGWVSMTFADMELKLALPVKPGAPKVATRQTAFGPATHRQVNVREDGVSYSAEMWSYPESAARVDDEAFFAELARDALFPGQHEMAEPAMRLGYGASPVRDVEYRSVVAADGSRVRARLRLFRSGADGWAFLTVEPADPRRSDDPGNALFGTIQLVGKPIGGP